MHRVLLSLALAFTLAPACSFASDAGEWQSRCEGDYCAFRKTLVYADTDAPFALLEVLISASDGASAFIVSVPLGVSLEPGVNLSTKGRNWQSPFKACFEDGCRATIKLESQDLTALLQNEYLEIRYIRFGETTPVSATLPLDGLVATMSNSSR